MIESVDRAFTIIDIIFCIIDFGIIFYLIYTRKSEQKPKPRFQSRIYRKKKK